ncbi:hypothetical protein FRC10_011455 [Ceratobasidium sp. 414]|nr:hypothetical protein FRC10_011455 [Ceratobasidium sp. 414]
MSLPDGTYQIFSTLTSSSDKQLRVARYYSELLLVNDSSGQTVDVKLVSGDTYTIQFSGHDTFFGPSDDISEDNSVSSRPGEYEWSINPAGGDEYKVHVAGQDLYWQLPDGAGNESRSAKEPGLQIKLVNSEGKQGELWTFVQK